MSADQDNLCHRLWDEDLDLFVKDSDGLDDEDPDDVHDRPADGLLNTAAERAGRLLNTAAERAGRGHNTATERAGRGHNTATPREDRTVPIIIALRVQGDPQDQRMPERRGLCGRLHG